MNPFQQKSEFRLKQAIRDVLSEAEIAKIEAFNEDSIMKEALRKVILFPIYYCGIMEKGKPCNPDINWLVGTFTDLPDAKRESLADEHRTRVLALRLLESAFNDLESFKKLNTSRSHPEINSV